MSKYYVKYGWSGYSRGTAVREIEADSPEEAEKLWYKGKLISNKVVRDDTELDIDTDIVVTIVPQVA